MRKMIVALAFLVLTGYSPPVPAVIPEPQLIEAEAACQQIAVAVTAGMQQRRGLVESQRVSNEQATEIAYHLTIDLGEANKALLTKIHYLTYFARNRATLAGLYAPVWNARYCVIGSLRGLDEATKQAILQPIDAGTNRLNALLPEVKW